MNLDSVQVINSWLTVLHDDDNATEATREELDAVKDRGKKSLFQIANEIYSNRIEE